jgi:uncharacterized damage-inducible protein DinB
MDARIQAADLAEIFGVYLKTQGGLTRMEKLTPEQAIFLMRISVPMLKSEHLTTKRVIKAIPLDKGDYRPEPVAKSAFDLAAHIASAENLFLNGIASGGFDFTIKMPESIRNSADIAAWYDETFEKNLSRLQALSAEQLMKVIDFRGRMQWPAVEFVPLAVNHVIHHRGQLSTYLRPMGSKVPSIYGESYDDAQARLAAQA